MHTEDTSECAVCADPRLDSIDAQRVDGVSARQIAATFELDLGVALQHPWHMWSPPKRRPGWQRLYRNSLRLDSDGMSAWLKLLPFKRDLWTRVDLADLGLIQRYGNWHCEWPLTRSRGYVVARWKHGVPRRRRQWVRLQRLLMAPPRGLEVDHINHDKLDNRRSNLRVVTHAQNMENRQPASQRVSRNRNNTSGIRGVSHDVRCGKWHSWRAVIQAAGGYYQKRFPFTDDGFAAATAWVEARQRDLMSYWVADQSDHHG